MMKMPDWVIVLFMYIVTLLMGAMYVEQWQSYNLGVRDREMQWVEQWYRYHPTCPNSDGSLTIKDYTISPTGITSAPSIIFAPGTTGR